MVKAFNANGDKVIFVDWRNGNQVHYWQAVGNTRVIGAMIGRAIINWDIAERTLIVGFSLGAQIAGEAGRYTQTNAGLMINECHGLDPAGPFYDGISLHITLRYSLIFSCLIFSRHFSLIFRKKFHPEYQLCQ